MLTPEGHKVTISIQQVHPASPRSLHNPTREKRKDCLNLQGREDAWTLQGVQDFGGGQLLCGVPVGTPTLNFHGPVITDPPRVHIIPATLSATQLPPRSLLSILLSIPMFLNNVSTCN